MGLLRLACAALALLGACQKSARTGAGSGPVVARPLPDVVDAEPPAPDGHYRVIKLGGAELAIVPRAMADDFPIWLKGGAKVAEYVTPSEAEVVRAEGALEAFIASQPDQQRRNPEPLSRRYHGYKRDWVGFVTAGRRKLYASFFCDAFDHDWTKEPIFVKDGGDCFFTVIFDVASGQFESFQANGEG